jgi:hypothetical protein
MKKSFIILSQLREEIKSSEFGIPISPPQKQAVKGIHLESPCSKCWGITGKLGAGRKPQEASLHCHQCKRFIRWISASELKSAKNTL